MRSNHWVRLAAAALAVACAVPANAVWLESQITPKSALSGNFAFVVKASDREGLRRFQVTVTAVGKRIMPFADAYLDLIDGGKRVAKVPVAAIETERTDRKAVFYFDVSPGAVAGSWLEVRFQGYELVTRQGLPTVGKYEMTLGGEAFWFWLRDFNGGRVTEYR